MKTFPFYSNFELDEMYEPSEALDDVVSLVLEGEIYYDVEYDDEKWIRLFLEKGIKILINIKTHVSKFKVMSKIILNKFVY